MKKTFTLSIGGSLFHVEEDAYEALDAYLVSIRTHFEGNENKDEIISDIESSIAEKFSEKAGAIITMSDVEAIIKAMGNVEQFDDAPEVEEIPRKSAKQLFRDPDNEIVAGVASGLGHFFGVDPIVFRVLFLISLFAGGSGVVIYIILWLLVPVAKTPSQKLAMNGTAPTIHAMADMLKKKFEEVNTPKHKNIARQIISIPVTIIRWIAQVFSKGIFPIIGLLVGIFMTLVSFGMVIAATIGASFALFGDPAKLFDTPLQALISSPLAHLLVAALYVVAIIPLIFFISFGVYLMVRRKTLGKMAALSLLTLWFVALGVASATGVKLGVRAADIVQNNPYYKRETTAETFQAFNSIVVTGNQSVRLVQGDKYTVETRARAEDRPHLVHTLDGTTLTIGKNATNETVKCAFCERGYVETTITVPSLSSVTVTDNSYVSGEVKGSDLTLKLDKDSSLTLGVKASTVTVTEEGSSNANLRGSVNKLMLTLGDHSRFEGEELIAESIIAKVVNSSQAFLYANKQLDVTEINNSYVGYKGNPQVIKHIDASSNINDNDARE